MTDRARSSRAIWPTTFRDRPATLPREAYDHAAPLGVSETTVIREFAFPTDALVRELVPAPGSPYLWGADVPQESHRAAGSRGRRDEVVSASTSAGSTGPHTIAPDDAGNLWVTMVDNDQFGRFDPRTEQWRLWTLRP